MLKPYISTAAIRFAPGNFVTAGTVPPIGVTLAIRDKSDCNPMVQVRWLPSCEVEWIRAEYLYLADHTC